MHSFIWKIWKYRNCKGQWVISYISSFWNKKYFPPLLEHRFILKVPPRWKVLLWFSPSSDVALCFKPCWSLWQSQVFFFFFFFFFSFLINHFPFNPLIPVSDQDRISPYNINTKSRRKVMSTRKSINWGIISWSNTKFSEVTWEEFYSRQ